ncbi:MAG: heme ABC exporter ATP-binding protein CcmA [Hyphomicrobiaceae bacterium]
MQLIVEDLAVERGGRRVLEGLSFRLGPGEALELIGPNGAGKTTLLRAIAGFLRPASGMIRLEGGAPDLEIAEACHYVGHRDGIKGALTVAENARFWSRYLGSAANVGEALVALGIDALAGVPAAWLSAGQRRRLGLARLLLARRPLWLLDEPSVSLDAGGVAALAGLIRRHCETGGLVIAATHVTLGLADTRTVQLVPAPARVGL